MQKLFEFPEDILSIGTKVFIPRPALNSVEEDEITGYFCVIMNDINNNNQPTIVPTDYRLNTINLSRGDLAGAWKLNEFFLSHEEAKANAKEYKIKATSEEWMCAIGLSGADDEDRLNYDDDKCELSSCCAIISAIRNILYEICLTGKIDSITRNELAQLIGQHEAYPDKPVLDKILKQLDIEWKL